jgi:hypothetical protein
MLSLQSLNTVLFSRSSFSLFTCLLDCSQVSILPNELSNSSVIPKFSGSQELHLGIYSGLWLMWLEISTMCSEALAQCLPRLLLNKHQ